jgi:outer membrane protein TolC
MVPNLTASFRYTRLSPYTVGTIAFPNYGRAIGEALMGNRSFIDMCTPSQFAAPQCGIPIPLTTAILDQYDLRVTLSVPISDILLRLARQYEAAGLSTEASRLQLEGARETAAQTARLAFYEYMRAIGRAAVADAALEAAQRRQVDVGQAVTAGTLPRAQLLATDAQVANLRRQSDLAHNLVVFNEARLRQLLHMAPGETIALGEQLDAPVDVPNNLADLIQRAMTGRPDVRSIDRQARSLDASVAATRAAQLPSLTGVGNFDYINPNTRVFPQVQRFDTTWDATLQLSWSPTQAFVAEATIARLRAQRAQLLAQQQAARDGAELEVRQYWMNAVNARSALAAYRAALASSEEAYRVARERVAAGAAVATDLASAESDLMNARFVVVDASVDLREQLAQLRHAAGDAEPTAPARH